MVLFLLNLVFLRSSVILKLMINYNPLKEDLKSNKN